MKRTSNITSHSHVDCFVYVPIVKFRGIPHRCRQCSHISYQNCLFYWFVILIISAGLTAALIILERWHDISCRVLYYLVVSRPISNAIINAETFGYDHCWNLGVKLVQT